jgi:excisionase family DNA binding protein
MSDSLPELLDIGRVCACLACSRHLVCRLRRERRIFFVRVGKELRFRAADVATWLELESVPAQNAQSKSSRQRRGRPRNRDRAA